MEITVFIATTNEYYIYISKTINNSVHDSFKKYLWFYSNTRENCVPKAPKPLHLRLRSPLLVIYTTPHVNHVGFFL